MRTTITITLAAVTLCLWTVGVVSAQEVPDTVGSIPGIEVTTSVDRADIYIGDLVTYTLSIAYDSSIQLEPPPLGANLGAFDVKDYQPDIRSTLPDGRLRSATVFKVTTFTTGDYFIPPIPILFTLPDSSRKVILSESVPIKVKSMLAEAGDSVDIRPLKAQYEFKRDRSAYYIWGGLAFIVILAVLILWFYLRKRKAESEPVDHRPPWEIAFEKLARLKQRNLPAESNYKEYYVKLTEIAREFLGRVYVTDVLEMTTEEFVDSFSELDLPVNLYERIESFLRHADLVKFAKFVPESSRPDIDFDFVHEMVESVRADYQRRQEAEVSVASNPSGKAPVVEEKVS